MTWHAVDAVDDAVGATRRFLFPFSVVRWTKLILLVLCMGAGVSTSVSVPPVPTVETETAGIADFTALATEVGVGTDVLIGLTVAMTVVTVLVAVVSLTLRLVFYDALRTNDVRLRGPFKRRLRQAVGLFGFSLLVGLLLGGPFALAALASERGAVSFDALSTGALIGAAGVAVALVVVGLLIARLTYEFVVPVMVLRNDGVFAAWRRFWGTLRASWTDFLVYLLVHFFLALGISIAESVVVLFVGGIAVVLAALVLLVAAGAFGGMTALTGTTTGLAVILAVVILTLLALLVVLLPIRLLTRTYLIAYEVSTLGGIDANLALLASEIDPSVDEGVSPEPPSRESARDGNG